MSWDDQYLLREYDMPRILAKQVNLQIILVLICPKQDQVSLKSKKGSFQRLPFRLPCKPI